MTHSTVPTLTDVYEARRRIAPYPSRTPPYEYPALSELVGAKVFVKHENHPPTSTFTVRGGTNLGSQLSPRPNARTA